MIYLDQKSAKKGVKKAIVQPEILMMDNKAKFEIWRKRIDKIIIKTDSECVKLNFSLSHCKLWLADKSESSVNDIFENCNLKTWFEKIHYMHPDNAEFKTPKDQYDEQLTQSQ